jgi:hypothetical protein
MNMKQACEIVYAGLNIGQDTCHHEWYQGKCIHCNLTADWAQAVRELNAKLGVEHNRTVEAERKNKNLLAEMERLTMELSDGGTKTLRLQLRRNPAVRWSELLDDDFMKMTLEQHRELGERVKEFRETLMQPQVMCIGKKSSRESRAVANALKHVDRMKNELDNVVCRDFPACKDATQIYYGMSEAWQSRDAKSSNDQAQRRRDREASSATET